MNKSQSLHPNSYQEEVATGAPVTSPLVMTSIPEGTHVTPVDETIDAKKEEVEGRLSAFPLLILNPGDSSDPSLSPLSIKKSPSHLEWVERDGIERDEPDDSPVTPNTIDMDFLPNMKASSGGSNKAAKTGK